MHSLIDEKMVQTIRETGKTSDSLADRKPILEEHGLPYDTNAENVIITGCQILPLQPQMLASFARVLDLKNTSYTFLSKEYCCGNYLYRPIIKARDESAMAECRDLSKEFVEKNIQQANELGAKRIVIFCSPCYPIYKNAFPEENIVFYPQMLSEAMGKVNFKKRIDYYAGCYRLHRKFSPVPMDLKSTEKVFENVEGLDIHRISAPKCCFHPEGLSHMIDKVETDLMVHICTGCYGQAVRNLPKDSGTEVLMLPDFVERVLGQ